MKKILGILIIATFIISCSDDLDRNDAKIQINSKIGELDCKLNIKKSWRSNYRSRGFCSVIITDPPNSNEIKKINYFIKRGLIKLNKETIYRDCAEWTKYTLSVTERGKPYLLKEENNKIYLLSAKFKIDEITGIKRENKSSIAIVEYKLKKIKKTPFADFSKINCYDEEKIYRKTFIKYDDGWRIK